MLTGLIAIAALTHAQGQVPAPPKQSPVDQLLSKMLKSYYDAKTVTGTILMTQTAADKTVQFQTQLQIERPSKIFMFQQGLPKRNPDFLLVSDGKYFRYDGPETGISKSTRLTESVFVRRFDPKTKVGLDVGQTVGQIFDAAAFRLGDRNPLIDYVLERPEDVAFVIGQLDKRQLEGPRQFTSTITGKPITANLIDGKWREADGTDATGYFELYITDKGELVRLMLKQVYKAPANLGGQEVQVNTTWDADLTIDGKIDASLFRLR